MAGVRMVKNFRRSTPQLPVEQQKGAGKAAASGLGAIKDSLDTLDTLHETRLENTGLLSDKTFTVGVEGELVDMFKRAPQDAPSLNPVSYYKRTTTPTFQRLVVNPEYMKTEGASIDSISAKLLESGYSQEDILDIVRGSEGIDIIPQPKFSTPLEPNQIIDPNLSTVNFMNTGQQGQGQQGQIGSTVGQLGQSLGKIKDKTGNIFGEIGSAVGEELTEFGGDIGELGKAIYGEGTEFVSDITKLIPEKGTEAISKSLDLLGKGAGKAADVVGKTATKAIQTIGKGADKALPVVGQALGAFKGFKGFDKLGKGQTGQGLEDIIQGSIDVATPFLIAAGPAGWAVIAANMLEDFFFD